MVTSGRPNNPIKINPNNLTSCKAIIGRKKTSDNRVIIETIDATFLNWENYSEIISPSLLIGGHSGGTLSKVFAIVMDNKTGNVYRVDPVDITFDVPDEYHKQKGE